MVQSGSDAHQVDANGTWKATFQIVNEVVVVFAMRDVTCDSTGPQLYTCVHVHVHVQRTTTGAIRSQHSRTQYSYTYS